MRSSIAIPKQTIGKIRKLRDRGFNAREIAKLTGYLPSDVRRVVCENNDLGRRFESKQREYKQRNDRDSVDKAIRELIDDGCGLEVIIANFGEAVVDGVFQRDRALCGELAPQLIS